MNKPAAYILDIARIQSALGNLALEKPELRRINYACAFGGELSRRLAAGGTSFGEVMYSIFVRWGWIEGRSPEGQMTLGKFAQKVVQTLEEITAGYPPEVQVRWIDSPIAEVVVAVLPEDQAAWVIARVRELMRVPVPADS